MRKKLLLPLLSATLLWSSLAISPLNEKVSAASTAPVYPIEVHVNYERGYSEAYQNEAIQPYVDLGGKKGTLVFKMYPTAKGIWSTNIWLEAKNNLTGAYNLTDKPGAFTENVETFYSFDLYSLWNQTGKKNIGKYETGFTNAGTAPNGKNYIALGVYLPKAQNNGRYYLQHSSMSEGSWTIKAYFYENINLEDELYSQVNKLFPLVGKVMWGKTEVKPSQIGRLTIKEKTTLYKLENGSLKVSRTLNPTEQYRIYGYKAEQGGLYDVGGGYYVKKEPSKALYETPSKSRLRLAEILYKE